MFGRKWGSNTLQQWTEGRKRCSRSAQNFYQWTLTCTFQRESFPAAQLQNLKVFCELCSNWHCQNVGTSKEFWVPNPDICGGAATCRQLPTMLSVDGANNLCLSLNPPKHSSLYQIVNHNIISCLWRVKSDCSRVQQCILTNSHWPRSG